MSTESGQRRSGWSPSGQLMMALVDILTGEVEAHVQQDVTRYGHPKWIFRVKKAPVQDD